MKKIFEQASNAKSIDELDIIIKQNSKLHVIIHDFEKKYPEIDLSLKKQDIEELITKNIITTKHLINLTRQEKFSPFEKLLLAVLWKNGHITRVQSIIDGIMDDQKSKSDFGLIFRQFGKSLVDPEEPIIDQHVLRAFCTYENVSNVQSRKKIPRKTAVKNSDQELVDAYITWFKNILQEVSSEEKITFKYRFDKILFAIGKSIE